MTSLAVSTLAVDTPMGQQIYEQELLRRAPAALGPSWDVRYVVVRTLRSPLAGTLRLPAALLGDRAPRTRRLAGAFAHRHADVVHRMDLRLPAGRPGEIVTIHDVVPWRYADEAVALGCARAEVRRAAIVVCPSAFSAGEITSVLGATDVQVIPNGVTTEWFDAPALTAAELARLGLRPPFVVHAGGATDRKNLPGLADAWELLAASEPDLSLALLGPGVERKRALFDHLPRTHVLGRLPAPLARSVMASAATAVVPSTYEGFGLPALEAMAAGVPVVAANRSSLPEVCGDAAVLVEPTAAALAEGVRTVLHEDLGDARDRGRARARLFSWETNASLHADLWRSLV